MIISYVKNEQLCVKFTFKKLTHNKIKKEIACKISIISQNILSTHKNS